MSESGHEKRRKLIDLNSEFGMSRRDLFRRGAVVGGTLLWAAPAVQTISAKAFAQTLESPGGACGTCYCVKYRANGTVLRDECNKNGITGIYASLAACQEFCGNGGNAFPGNTTAYTASASQWCQGTGFNCNCSSRTAGNPAPFGVNCT